MLSAVVGVICFWWYVGVVLVCSLGYYKIFRYYQSSPPQAVSETLPQHEIPPVTIIRPCKGLEPNLYECLASTFRQSYPASKTSIRFCISSRNDAALPTLERLLQDFPEHNAQILVEEEDAALDHGRRLGPNPKIRNMSRAYREAQTDIIWIIDCNVWVGPGVLGRMVDKLSGFSPDELHMKYKFVHQLPLAIDVTEEQSYSQDGTSLDHASDLYGDLAASTSTAEYETTRSSVREQHGVIGRAAQSGGGRLEELFLASSHAKFYTAINTVLIAPCIVGKSNMFRKSHLASLTSGGDSSHPSGIDYFSYNICEDHLIGDLLWKQKVPEERQINPEKLGKHAMLYGDLAIQPIANMKTTEYIARRVRWLRVRKFTVTLATLVEPGTESFLCSLYGAYAVTTIPFFVTQLGIPPTWSVFGCFWFLSVALWASVDWTLYRMLHAMGSVEVDETTPAFIRRRHSKSHRTFRGWLGAWLGREALALPIWIWAVLCGTTVNWRGKRFKVGMDMRVHALDSANVRSNMPEQRHTHVNGNGKARQA